MSITINFSVTINILLQIATKTVDDTLKIKMHMRHRLAGEITELHCTIEMIMIQNAL
jgi:hypothetical protein